MEIMFSALFHDAGKPKTRRELEEVLAKDRIEAKKDFREAQAIDLAKILATSEAETKLIVAKWKNRIFPEDMPLEEQIEEMFGAVNRKKLMSQNSELSRALNSKSNSSKNFASSHHEEIPVSTLKISKGDEMSYKRAGFIYDNKEKVWKKKLPTGKFLIKDPRIKDKTKQTYLAS